MQRLCPCSYSNYKKCNNTVCCYPKKKRSQVGSKCLLEENNELYLKASNTEQLDVNKPMYKFFHGEITVTTHLVCDQRIRSFFYSFIRQNLRPSKSNIKDINFYWINCMMSVIVLWKPLFCPKSNTFMFCCLIQLSIANTIHQAFL